MLSKIIQNLILANVSQMQVEHKSDRCILMMTMTETMMSMWEHEWMEEENEDGKQKKRKLQINETSLGIASIKTAFHQAGRRI